MQKNAPNETIDALKGAKGSLRVIEGRVMFRWNGDELWPVANPATSCGPSPTRPPVRRTGRRRRLLA